MLLLANACGGPPSKWNGLVTTTTVRDAELLATPPHDGRAAAGAGAAAHAAVTEHNVSDGEMIAGFRRSQIRHRSAPESGWEPAPETSVTCTPS